MGKYEPLGHFLRKQRTREVPLAFREIEKIIGVKLPPKAQHQRAWWSNNPDNNVMTKVWLAAGFESAQVEWKDASWLFVVWPKQRRRPVASPSPCRSPMPPRTGGIRCAAR